MRRGDPSQILAISTYNSHIWPRQQRNMTFVQAAAEQVKEFVQAAAEQVKEFGLTSREAHEICTSSSRASKRIWPHQQRST